MLLNKDKGEHFSVNGEIACVWKSGDSTLRVSDLKPDHTSPGFSMFRKVSFGEEYDESDFNEDITLDFKVVKVEQHPKGTHLGQSKEMTIKSVTPIGGNLMLILTNDNQVAYVLGESGREKKLYFPKEFNSYKVERIFESPERQFAFSVKGDKRQLFGCKIKEEDDYNEEMEFLMLKFEISPIEKWVNVNKLPHPIDVDDIGLLRLDDIGDPFGIGSFWGQLFLKDSGKIFAWGFKAYTLFHEGVSKIFNDKQEGVPKDKLIQSMFSTEEGMRTSHSNWRDPFELDISPLRECVFGTSNGIGTTRENYVWFFGIPEPTLLNLERMDPYGFKPPFSVNAPEEVSEQGTKLFAHPSGNIVLVNNGNAFKWTELTPGLSGEDYVHIPIHVTKFISDMIPFSRDMVWGTDGKGSLYFLVDGPAAISVKKIPLKFYS